MMVDSATSYDLGAPEQPPQPVPYDESDMGDEDDSDGEEAAHLC